MLFFHWNIMGDNLPSIGKSRSNGLEPTHWETRVRACRVAERKNGLWKDKCFLNKQFLLHPVKTPQGGKFSKAQA